MAIFTGYYHHPMTHSPWPSNATAISAKHEVSAATAAGTTSTDFAIRESGSPTQTKKETVASKGGSKKGDASKGGSKANMGPLEFVALSHRPWLIPQTATLINSAWKKVSRQANLLKPRPDLVHGPDPDPIRNPNLPLTYRVCNPRPTPHRLLRCIKTRTTTLTLEG